MRHLVIRASAGTGKTFQLALRYIALLHRGVPPEWILATTFTRKAAGEILERIVTRLAEAALDDARCRELGGFLGAPKLARGDCLIMLQTMLRRLHRLRISTLDSLFAQLARSFSLEIGLPPGWRIVDDAEEESLRDAAIDLLVRQEETGELLSLTHLLTKGEATRGVHQLIQETVRSLHGLYQETDEQAWHALPRFKPLPPEELAAVLNALRQFVFPGKRSSSARDGDCERAELEDWESFLSRGLAAKVLSGELTFYNQPIPDEACRLYQRLFDQARSVLANRVVLQTEGSYRLLRRFDEVRRRLQQQHRGLRFDDITRALDRALRDTNLPETTASDPNASAPASSLASQRDLAHRLDGHVAHLLLDEFQDTSPVQWRALRGFVDGVIGERTDSSFFCVGDVKQAIYGWRGGVAEIFDDIERQLPQLEQKQLNMSFRSSQAVIDCVNRVFQGTHRHPELVRAAEGVAAWSAGYEEHVTAHARWDGYACLRTARAAEEGARADDAVLDSAVELIGELHGQAPTREIGVLVRKNATVAGLIYRLRARGLPASEEGGNPLTDSAAVQLLLSLLRLSDHPADTVARFHIAQSPLGPVRGLAAFDDDAAARRLAAEIREELQTGGYGPTLQRWAGLLGGHISHRDRVRLEQLVERAFDYQSRASLRADDFRRVIELERVAEPSRSPIRVMTVHQSKGLEFDAVVLPELDEPLVGQTPAFVVERLQPTAPVSCVCRYANHMIQNLLPPRFQQMYAQNVRGMVVEAMCLLYVALTRAIHGLYILVQPSTARTDRLKQTMAGIVRAALAADQLAPPQTLLFECGNPDWWRSLEPVGQEPPQPVAVPAVMPSQVIIELAPAERRTRGLERISPSGLEGGRHLRLRRQFDIGADSATLRGTVLHACFAQVKWADGELPSDATLREVVAECLRSQGQPPEPGRWVDEFRRLIRAPWLREQLCRELYGTPERLGFSAAVAGKLIRGPVQLQVETEQSFAIRDPDGILSGSIDRLVLLCQDDKVVAADIIDFKTDAVEPGDQAALKQRSEYYLPQLTAYRRAVGRLTGLPSQQIATRLLFVAAGEVVFVT